MAKNDKYKNKILSFIKTFKDVSIYAKEINGNRVIAFNENRLYFTASCFKVITAIALYHKLEHENLDDDMVIDFEEKDKVPGSGILKNMRPHSNSIYNYAVLMLKMSDNTATDILVNYVTREYQNKIIEALGLRKTNIRQNCREVCAAEYGLNVNATPEIWDKECIKRKGIHVKNSLALQTAKGDVSTAYELYKVLEELINPKLISKENAQKIIEIMMMYDPDDRILEFGSYIEIAHKGGWFSSVRADMNIVYSKNPFYLVLMGKQLTNPEKNRLMNKYNKILKLAIKYFE